MKIEAKGGKGNLSKCGVCVDHINIVDKSTTTTAGNSVWLFVWSSATRPAERPHF